jgi:ribosome-binding factor A
MEYQRSERVADLLLQVVAELLTREVHDPRLKWLNLTGARLSHDLRRATIYFNLLKAGANEAEAVAGLRSAGGFIRARVSKQLKLRFAPTIEFVYDNTEEHARHIEALLKKTRA